MLKAYLINGTIKLRAENGKEVVFSAGSAVTRLAEEKENSPYALFSGVDLKKLTKTAECELEKLYEITISAPEQVLYQMDEGRQNKRYLNCTLSFSYEAENDAAVTTVLLQNADALLTLELICAIQSRKRLKKCENCGKFFFPVGRSDAIYCDRTGTDGFSCKKIGAHRQYRKNSRADSVKVQYDKITKHNRYLKNRGMVSEREYDRWLKTVSELYTGFKNGNISERTLMTRLGEELTSSRISTRNSISDYLL